MRFYFVIVTIVLISCQKSDVDISNEWRLTSYVKGPGEMVKNSGFYLKIELTKDKNFTAFLNTNECIGNYTNGVKNFEITNLSCDSLCCDSSLSREALHLIMDSVETYAINGNVLKLSGSSFTKLEFNLVQ